MYAYGNKIHSPCFKMQIYDAIKDQMSIRTIYELWMQNQNGIGREKLLSEWC